MKRKIFFLSTLMIVVLSLSAFSFAQRDVDKTSEEKQIGRIKDPLERATLRIKFAEKRMDLIKAKGEEGKTEEISSLVDEYKDNIDKANEEIEKAENLGIDTSSALNTVKTSTLKHIEVLKRVLAKVPEQAKDAIRHAIEVSQRGHQKAMENLKKRKDKEKDTGKGKGKSKGKGRGQRKT